MQKQIIEHPELILVGLKIRTSFQHELNPETSNIGPLVNRYMAENVAARIPNRKNPGIVLIGYANYASDEYGEYDFYYGEEVSNDATIPEGLALLSIPAGKYLQLTPAAGKVPGIYINTWQDIWNMTRSNALGGQRKYQIDFEKHDHRQYNPENVTFDVYLGVD